MDRKKEASISFSRKASGYRIKMQLIEGQVCVLEIVLEIVQDCEHTSV